MSNTGRNKKLASFNCDEELWTEFVSRCQEKGTTATATLIQFIKLYLDGSLDNLGALRGSAEYERVKAYIDEELAAERDKWAQLQSTVVALSLKVEELERLGGTSSKKSPKKREYWFIKDRAKYLEIHISAAQLIHIEMLANDFYKKRYGQLPSTQLYRGTQTYAYPDKDIELLDDAIKKIMERW